MIKKYKAFLEGVLTTRLVNIERELKKVEAEVNLNLTKDDLEYLDREFPVKVINGNVRIYKMDLPRFLENVEINGNLEMVGLTSEQFNVQYLPKSCTKLSITNCEFNDLITLPDTDNVLLTSMNFENLSGLKECLNLVLNSCELTSLENMPNSVNSLHLMHSKIKEGLKYIPNSVKDLTLESTYIDSLEYLPSSLTSLTILYNKLIKNLKGLPNNLHSLVLVETNIKSLEYLPSSVKKLSVLHTPLSDISNFNLNASESYKFVNTTLDKYVKIITDNGVSENDAYIILKDMGDLSSYTVEEFTEIIQGML